MSDSVRFTMGNCGVCQEFQVGDLSANSFDVRACESCYRDFWEFLSVAARLI